MDKIPVILIYDVGKTNKKILLFDEQYNIVYEESRQLAETKDEDGFPCEDVATLADWIKSSFKTILADDRFTIRVVNFSAYGASFVCISRDGKVIFPLYNYLKPYPQNLQKKFYDDYGGESLVARQTASPVLGNLNSGMQLYRLKYEKPALFRQIAFALHLPQFLSYLLTDYPATDITGIGCHTQLWNYSEHAYHHWVNEEGIEKLFAPLLPGSTAIPFVFENKNILSGMGLHDSSAALIPYLATFTEPFILLSTGTWSISLNPFNHSPLTDDELKQDCLCYLSYEGKPVKASRLFAGYEHEQQLSGLAEHFKTNINQYKMVKVDIELLEKMKSISNTENKMQQGAMTGQSKFAERDLNKFKNYEEAYCRLVADIMELQVCSTDIVLKGTPVKRIFVDGGFCNNPIYMNLLAMAYPEMEVYAAALPQASALGAAMVMHSHWNSKPLPAEIIKLQKYPA